MFIKPFVQVPCHGPGRRQRLAEILCFDAMGLGDTCALDQKKFWWKKFGSELYIHQIWSNCSTFLWINCALNLYPCCLWINKMSSKSALSPALEWRPRCKWTYRPIVWWSPLVAVPCMLGASWLCALVSVTRWVPRGDLELSHFTRWSCPQSEIYRHPTLKLHFCKKIRVSGRATANFTMSRWNKLDVRMSSPRWCLTLNPKAAKM